MSDLDDEEGGADVDESWMGTFSDLCLLLLVFFVLMVSMSTMEETKFLSVAGSIRDAFGGLLFTEPPSGTKIASEGSKDIEDIQVLIEQRRELLEAQSKTYDAIRSYMTTNGIEGEMDAVFNNGIITLKVPGDTLFAPAAEKLSPEAEGALSHLLSVFEENKALSINIKGYTDNTPIPAEARFKGSWELSALRATNVLRWFVEHGVPASRMTATGMGDLDPLFPNDTPENQARNRRVEFVLERKVNSSSPTNP